MEYSPGGCAVVYDTVGNEISEMQPDAPSFVLAKGDNALRFSDAAKSGHPAGVRITLRTNDDKPLR